MKAKTEFIILLVLNVFIFAGLTVALVQLFLINFHLLIVGLMIVIIPMFIMYFSRKWKIVRRD